MTTDESLAALREGRHLAVTALVVLVLAALSGAPALRAAAETQDEDPARQLFRLSAVALQLELLGADLDHLLLLQAANFSPVAIRVVREVAAEKYGAAALEAEILPHLSDRLDLPKAEIALAWLRSPLGRRVNMLDAIATSPQSKRAMQSYVEELRQHPASAERRVLVERLAAATHYTEQSIDMGLSVMEALVLGLDATQPPELRKTPTLIHDQIGSTRAQALEEGAEFSVAALMYSYFTLSLEDLQQLVEFAESAPGRWYHETVWAATQQALDAIAIRFHRDLVKEIGRLQSEGAL